MEVFSQSDVSRNFKNNIMFEDEPNDFLLHKIMNSENYSHEYIKEMHNELEKRRIKNSSNEMLIFEFIFSEKYSKENLTNVGLELKNRGIDTSKFDDFTYIDCVVFQFPSGWESLLKEMFLKLKDNGWNAENRLHFDFSFGSINIEGLRNKSNPVLNDIVEDYISNLFKTCCHCSSTDKVEYFEDLYLCPSCMLEIINKREILEISKFGFVYYNGPIYENEIGRFDKIRWSEIKYVAFEQNLELDIIKVDLNKLTEEELSSNEETSNSFFRDNYISFSSDYHINFFELLRHIPQNILSTKIKEEINYVLKKIKKCKVCEKKAIINDKCLLCGNYSSQIEKPREIWIKRFGSKENYLQHLKDDYLSFTKGNYSHNYILENDKSFK